MLAGCSAAQDSERTAPSTEKPARQFSDEDRLAAQALSISNRNTGQEAGSPYDQAMACSSAIAALEEMLRQADTMTEEQLDVIGQAKGVYDQRIRLLGQIDAAGATPGEDLQQAPQDTPAGGKALEAIGCIQRLAEAG
jgi:hypothetical protein